MKRKVILGLLVHSLVFALAGAYVATKIRATTDSVERVIRLHQAEILREDFLLRLRTLQSDRARASLPQDGRAEADVSRLRAAVEGCFGCHHSAEATSRLEAIGLLTERYRRALASLPTGAASAGARDAADALGEELVRQLRVVMNITDARLAQRTLTALGEVARTKYVVYGLALLGPILSIVLWLAVGTGLTRSLDALVQATRQLKAGDLDHRVEGLRDEFAELSDSFNEMAGSLQTQIRLMQRTEQLVVVGELAAGLVHEIKNPLAGIKAAMQVLAKEASVSEEDREVLRKVAREVVGLESLLKSFLEFAKPSRPRLADVDVNEFVESVVAFYMRSHAVRPGQPVRIVRTLGPVPPVRVDPMQLQQILLNLLLNAVDAMPNGGAVEVRTASDGPAGELHIDIADGGRGIAPEHAGQIFRPFFTTKAGGTGLGLAVSKRLAEQQGGSISFTRNAGGGTTFRIRLPAARAA